MERPSFFQGLGLGDLDPKGLDLVVDTYILLRNVFGRSNHLKSMKLRRKRYSVYTTSFVVTSPTSYYLGCRWLLYV